MYKVFDWSVYPLGLPVNFSINTDPPLHIQSSKAQATMKSAYTLIALFAISAFSTVWANPLPIDESHDLESSSDQGPKDAEMTPHPEDGHMETEGDFDPENPEEDAMEPDQEEDAMEPAQDEDHIEEWPEEQDQ